MSNFKANILEKPYGTFYTLSRQNQGYRPKSQSNSLSKRSWKITDDDMTKPLKVKMRTVKKNRLTGVIEDEITRNVLNKNYETESTYTHDFNKSSKIRTMKELKKTFDIQLKRKSDCSNIKYSSINEYLEKRRNNFGQTSKNNYESPIQNQFITDRQESSLPKEISTSQINQDSQEIPYYEPSPEELAEIESALYESISEKEPQILEFVKNVIKDKNINIETFVENNSEYLAHAIGFCACARCECGCCQCDFIRNNTFGNLKLSTTQKSQYSTNYIAKETGKYDLPCPASVFSKLSHLHNKSQLHHKTTFNSDYIPLDIDPELYNRKPKVIKINDKPLFSLTTYNNQFKDWKSEKRNLIKSTDSQKKLPIDLKLSSLTTYAESFVGGRTGSTIRIKRPNMHPYGSGLPFLKDTTSLHYYSKPENVSIERRKLEKPLDNYIYDPRLSEPELYKTTSQTHFNNKNKRYCPGKFKFKKDRLKERIIERFRQKVQNESK